SVSRPLLDVPAVVAFHHQQGKTDVTPEQKATFLIRRGLDEITDRPLIAIAFGAIRILGLVPDPFLGRLRLGLFQRHLTSLSYSVPVGHPYPGAHAATRPPSRLSVTSCAAWSIVT
ncbi:MAG TPA: hypothetical protein VFY46_00860, partial [Acidimicrobiia bacterium]|nr:hypothetical protein [Acidimicrobiia bacterium]